MIRPANHANQTGRKSLRLGTDALETRTKDLQIAAYVTEALGWVEGLDGLRQGFELLRALQDEFWTSVFPLYDQDGDLEQRVSPSWFIDESIPQVLHLGVPLTAVPLAANYTLQDFNPASLTDTQREARNDAIRRTDPAFHLRLFEDFNACRAAFDAWVASSARHTENKAPFLEKATEALTKLDRCLRTIESVRPFMPSKPERDPGDGQMMGPETAQSEIDGHMPASSASARSGANGQTASAHPADGTRDRATDHPADDGRDIAAVATELAESGRVDAAIEILDRARQSARCRRDRFIRQLELVELCIRRGLTHVARPLVDELAVEQETRNLEAWEDPNLCARVLMALIMCLRTSPGDMDRQRIPGILSAFAGLSRAAHSGGTWYPSPRPASDPPAIAARSGPRASESHDPSKARA